MSGVQPNEEVTYVYRFKDAKSAIEWVESNPRIVTMASHIGQPYFENKIPYAPWSIDITVTEKQHTQRRSVAKAAKALENYDNNDVECDLIDLLVDLRHFADFYGLKIHQLLDKSYTHYCDEISDAGWSGVMLEEPGD